MDNQPKSTLDPRYLAFVEVFNRGDFFEAHEVLEPLWLGLRKTPDDSFYKGLIQLAGAFVHVQKSRKSPAIALLKLAGKNLQTFPPGYQQLDLTNILALIDTCLQKLEKNQMDNFTPRITWVL